MTPDVVVDVGNSFTKFAVVVDGKIGLHSSSADLNAESGFFDSVAPDSRPTWWLVAGVNPRRQAVFVAWAVGRGDQVTEVTSYQQLPIRVDVEHPDRVGLDRLIGAVAANRVRNSGRPAVTVDVGTAVTVNAIDAAGIFTGGLILPGPRLMTESLRQGTAQLPAIEFGGLPVPRANFPARSTEDAVKNGVRFAIAGAVRLAVENCRAAGDAPQLFVTGGNSHLIADLIDDLDPEHREALNLEGLLITAESLP